MYSLLGQFYSRIKGSQEDIASEGLNYILQRSKSARLAIIKIIKSDCDIDFDDLSFVTQNIGNRLERPDISGFDSRGREVLILEAKFWAALTDNQPIAYLNRLSENSVLIFICPALRVRSVFNEVLKRIKTTQNTFSFNLETHSIIFDNNMHVMIKSWNEVLGMVKVHLVQDNAQQLISDIDQIIGLCNTIDSNAFLPIQSEDLSPKYAKRINSYYDLVDKVIDELKKLGIADTLGMNATPQRCGYTRYFKTKTFGVSLNLEFEYWATKADTPFWINLKNITDMKVWSVTDDFKRQCKIASTQLGYTTYEANNREIFFALFPPLDKNEDIVIKDLTEQIIKLTTVLEQQMN